MNLTNTTTMLAKSTSPNNEGVLPVHQISRTADTQSDMVMVIFTTRILEISYLTTGYAVSVFYAPLIERRNK